MVLPLFKVLSLVVRVFSKPLISYTKSVHLKNNAELSHPLARQCFVTLGNSYHKMETGINRKFMKIQTQFAFKPLNDDLAIIKGIQFFYQILFYFIVIGLPVYEMMQSSDEAKDKSDLLNKRLQSIDQRLQKIIAKEQAKEQKKIQQNQKLEQTLNLEFQASLFAAYNPVCNLTLTFPFGTPKKYPILFKGKSLKKHENNKETVQVIENPSIV